MIDTLDVHAGIVDGIHAVGDDFAVSRHSAEDVVHGVALAQNCPECRQNNAVGRHVFVAFQAVVQFIPVVQYRVAANAYRNGLAVLGNVIDVGKVVVVHRLHLCARRDKDDKRNNDDNGKKILFHRHSSLSGIFSAARFLRLART